jgi:ABC-type siderophore export system fused ATPase/permease subunit
MTNERDDEKPILDGDSAELVAEVVREELAKTPGAPGPQTINVQVVFQAIAEHEEDPQKWAQTMRTILAVAKEAQDQELDFFKRQADAVIEAKTKDPELKNGRANSFSRRVLRYAVASTLVLSLVGCVLLVYIGADWPVVAALIAVVTFCAVLATGLAAGGDAPTPEQIAVLAKTARESEQRGDVDAPRPRPQSQRKPSKKKGGR